MRFLSNLTCRLVAPLVTLLATLLEHICWVLVAPPRIRRWRQQLRNEEHGRKQVRATILTLPKYQNRTERRYAIRKNSASYSKNRHSDSLFKDSSISQIRSNVTWVKIPSMLLQQSKRLECSQWALPASQALAAPSFRRTICFFFLVHPHLHPYALRARVLGREASCA